MTKMLIAVVAGLAILMPMLGAAAPDEAQKQFIQRAQEAKKKLSAAQVAAGAERQRMMQGMPGMGMHGMARK